MAGRPLKYKTVDELQRAIDCYFDSCKGETLRDENGMPVFDKNGKLVRINQKTPTITGLALGLGFNSRQALLNYQGKAQFNDTITRAKSMVEEYAESRLFDRDGARGAEFSLRCNFRWNDKQSDIENEKEKIEAADKVIVAIRKAASQEDTYEN